MRIFTALVIIGLCFPSAMAQQPTEKPANPNDKAESNDLKEKRPVKHERRKKPAYPRSHLALLNARLPAVEFDQLPLQQVFDWLADETGSNLIVHWSKMAESGIDGLKPISLRVRNLRVSQVLWLILNQAADKEARLAYRATADMIVVSTVAEFEADLVTRVYDVQDLLHTETITPRFLFGQRQDYVAGVTPAVASGVASVQPIIGQVDSGTRGGFPTNGWTDEEDQRNPQRRVDKLIDAIVNTVEPESWQVNGGRGTIRFYEGQLIIRNTVLVHQDIGGYLNSRERP